MKGAKLYVLILAGILLLTFSGCERIKEAYSKLGQGPGSGPAAPAEAPVFAVNTTTATQGQIRDYIALSGDIVAGSTVDTYSDAAGKVTRLFVSVGSRVRKGDPIAEVDPSRPGMNYVPGIAEAPVGGTVVSLPAQVGMTISQAVPLARIAAGSALEIKLYVAERFISKISMGLPCEISLDAWPGEVFRGTISEVSPVVDPASRTMEVRVNVDNPGSRLKAGMFAKVRIITERKNGIVKIPAGALIERLGEEYIFTVEADPENAGGFVVRKTIIKPGIVIDGVMEVQEGLGADTEIVVRGQTLLTDGARINIIEKVPPLAAN
ncbi:MAG: efflux RND transporter periplasmic adaptor subunit [Treponema sp.]|jgi:multidrug efflux pump subunit AcrA (membrane-fusion protein)|nr:efflux RND transporter periplasmic adaptor subunit [Treponema sp.]